jgi:hypothetical protein
MVQRLTDINKQILQFLPAQLPRHQHDDNH